MDRKLTYHITSEYSSAGKFLRSRRYPRHLLTAMRQQDCVWIIHPDEGAAGKAEEQAEDQGEEQVKTRAEECKTRVKNFVARIPVTEVCGGAQHTLVPDTTQ